MVSNNGKHPNNGQHNGQQRPSDAPKQANAALQANIAKLGKHPVTGENWTPEQVLEASQLLARQQALPPQPANGIGDQAGQSGGQPSTTGADLVPKEGQGTPQGARWACYLRISTDDDQDHEGQRHKLHEWMTNHGHNPAQATWYEDVATRDKMAGRVQLDRLKEDLFMGRVTHVVLTSFERLGVDIVEMLVLMRAWDAQGVTWVSLGEPWLNGLDPLFREFLFHALTLAGNIEKQRNHERQRAGIQAAKVKDQGLPDHLKKYKGNPKKKNVFKGNVKRAHELREQGLSLTEIGRALAKNGKKPISRQTVARYLKMDPNNPESEQVK